MCYNEYELKLNTDKCITLNKKIFACNAEDLQFSLRHNAYNACVVVSVSTVLIKVPCVINRVLVWHVIDSKNAHKSSIFKISFP